MAASTAALALAAAFGKSAAKLPFDGSTHGANTGARDDDNFARGEEFTRASCNATDCFRKRSRGRPSVERCASPEAAGVAAAHWS